LAFLLEILIDAASIIFSFFSQQCIFLEIMWNVVPDSKCHVDQGSPYQFRWRSREIEPFREL